MGCWIRKMGKKYYSWYCTTTDKQVGPRCATVPILLYANIIAHHRELFFTRADDARLVIDWKQPMREARQMFKKNPSEVWRAIEETYELSKEQCQSSIWEH